MHMNNERDLFIIHYSGNSVKEVLNQLSCQYMHTSSAVWVFQFGPGGFDTRMSKRPEPLLLLRSAGKSDLNVKKKKRAINQFQFQEPDY